MTSFDFNIYIKYFSRP